MIRLISKCFDVDEPDPLKNRNVSLWISMDREKLEISFSNITTLLTMLNMKKQELC
ncbi:hypothetical protein Hanom_Chr15g01389881 [Helianthus anomalus]